MAMTTENTFSDQHQCQCVGECQQHSGHCEDSVTTYLYLDSIKKAVCTACSVEIAKLFVKLAAGS